jgi:hypothetical protein
MKLIFTKSSSPLSVLIRWGLREPFSHFAVVFDEKFVMHSNLYGINLAWLRTFLKHSEIMAEIPVPISLDHEEILYRNLLDSYDGRHYDYGAFLFFMWRGFLNRIFKIPFPRKNRFGNKEAFLCTEVALLLPLGLQLPQDLGMISPYRLYNILKSQMPFRSTSDDFLEL